MGSYDAIPRRWRAIRTALQGMRAKVEEDRQRVILIFHFSKEVRKKDAVRWGPPKAVLLVAESAP
jgi:hypothetical protein